MGSGSLSELYFGVCVFLIEGEGRHAFIMKLLPVDLSCLEEVTHLLTGMMQPRLEGAQGRRQSQIEQCGRVPVLAGRSLQGLHLLQVPFGPNPGQEWLVLLIPASRASTRAFVP